MVQEASNVALSNSHLQCRYTGVTPNNLGYNTTTSGLKMLINQSPYIQQNLLKDLLGRAQNQLQDNCHTAVRNVR